eukprot:2017839-Ditylum_brightwellii.AAC.1
MEEIFGNEEELFNRSPPCVKQLQRDLEALDMLRKSKDLLLCLICGSAITTTVYGFGGIPVGGFGSTFLVAQDVEYLFGLWDDKTSAVLSNLRVDKNLVDAIETKGKAG